MIEGFHRPATVTEALELKASLGPGAFFLAGGTELNHLLFPHRVRQVVSLAGLGLGGIAPTESGHLLGATTTFEELLESPDLPPLLRRAAARLTNRNVRNVATVGGHVALGKSCADLIPALVALDAKVLVATSSGSGAWQLVEYLATRPQGLIVAVEVPDPAPGRSFGLAGFKRTANDISLVNAAAALERQGDIVTGPVLALGGAGPHVLRLDEVEAVLEGRPMPTRTDLEALVTCQARTMTDSRGSAAFKRQLAATLAADALLEAWNAGEAC